MTVFFVEFDGGNGWCKFGNGQVFKTYVHALRSLRTDERQRREQSAHVANMYDYIEVFEGVKSKSSTVYTTGMTALTDGFREFRSGAERYKTGYYDVLALRAITALLRDSSFEKPMNDNEVTMTVTHAPQDSGFAKKIEKCLLGWHKVQNGGKTFYYNITYVQTLDEPVAGLLNYTLDVNGKPYPKDQLWTAPGRVLVLDMGSYTTNWQEADQNGVPANEGHSVTAGVDRVKQQFVDIMRRNYPDVFTNGDSISTEMVDDAFMSKRGGHYTLWASGRPFECDRQIEEATAPLLNEVLSYYHKDYRGGKPYGTIILDGGGCGLMNEVLREKLDHENVRLAERLKKIQFANVKGASKLRKMLVRKGYL